MGTFIAILLVNSDQTCFDGGKLRAILLKLYSDSQGLGLLDSGWGVFANRVSARLAGHHAAWAGALHLVGDILDTTRRLLQICSTLAFCWDGLGTLTVVDELLIFQFVKVEHSRLLFGRTAVIFAVTDHDGILLDVALEHFWHRSSLFLYLGDHSRQVHGWEIGRVG